MPGDPNGSKRTGRAVRPPTRTRPRIHTWRTAPDQEVVVPALSCEALDRRVGACRGLERRPYDAGGETRRDCEVQRRAPMPAPRHAHQHPNRTHSQSLTTTRTLLPATAPSDATLSGPRVRQSIFGVRMFGCEPDNTPRLRVQTPSEAGNAGFGPRRLRVAAGTGGAGTTSIHERAPFRRRS